MEKVTTSIFPLFMYNCIRNSLFYLHWQFVNLSLPVRYITNTHESQRNNMLCCWFFYINKYMEIFCFCFCFMGPEKYGSLTLQLHNFKLKMSSSFCWRSVSVCFWASRFRIRIRYMYGSGSGSFHQIKTVIKTFDFYCFVFSLWPFIFEELCKWTRVPDPYVSGPPGSVCQKYGSGSASVPKCHWTPTLVVSRLREKAACNLAGRMQPAQFTKCAYVCHWLISYIDTK